MDYHQLTSGERYPISALKTQDFTPSEIADEMSRHRSTVYRELERNACNDGRYRVSKAISKTPGDAPDLAVTAGSVIKISKSSSGISAKNGTPNRWLPPSENKDRSPSAMKQSTRSEVRGIIIAFSRWLKEKPGSPSLVNKKTKPKKK